MKRKLTQWDKDAEFGSDIFGVGCYSMLPPSGKPKKQLQIGFIRKKEPVKCPVRGTAKRK